MIKHIVTFRLFDFAEGATKADNAIKIKNLLSGLPAKIEQIRSYEIGMNEIQSERAADLILISTFDNYDDMTTYLNHPEHQKCVEFVNKVRSESRFVDFTY